MCPSAEWIPHSSGQVQRLPSHEAERFVEPSKLSTATTYIATADGSLDFRGRPASRVTTGGWKTSPALFGAAMFEAVVNLSIAFNLNLYLLGPMHLHPIHAATALSNYWGASYLTSLLGGFMSSAFLGNYWTIIVAMLIELVGVALLIISSAIAPLMPECVKNKLSRGPCLPANATQYGVCMFSVYLIAVGAGCIRPCLSAFGGDQFDQEDAAEREKTPRFFNWLVVSMTCGGVLATTLVVHLGENVSWTWSFISIGLAMMMATLFFLAGTGRYRHQKAAGSPLTRIFQVFVAAFRNGRVTLPTDASELHEINDAESMLPEVQDGKPYYLLRHTKGMRFFDRAAVADASGANLAAKASPWRLCTVTQVEEVKGLLRCMPVAMGPMLLYMVLAQVQTWTTQQGYSMDRRIGTHYLIPPATLTAIAIGVVILEIVAYDYLLVGVLRRYTGCPQGLSHCQRIGVGLAMSVVGLAYAALLESIRLDVARSHYLVNHDSSSAAIVPLSVFWQLPILVIMGTAIFFAHAGLFEFFYYESPVRMRSLGTALSMLPIAGGLFQNGGFMVGVNALTKKLAGKGWLESSNLNLNHLNYFYLLMAAMSLVNFVIHLITTHFYQHKQYINIATIHTKLSQHRVSQDPSQTHANPSQSSSLPAEVRLQASLQL